MLMIHATSFNGRPLDAPPGTGFGEQGGVIGRADGNALVLPDPDRYVSRAHALVVFRDGAYAIRDLSNASPVYVNGRPLGTGNEAALADGDELQIGGYTLKVADEGPATVQVPLPRAAVTAPPQPDSAPKDDPLGLFGGAVPPPASGGGGIPDDFSFSEVLPPPAAPAPRREPDREVPDDGHLGLGNPSGSDINQLFGLGPAGDPFPSGHPLAAGGRHGAGGINADPLVAIGAAAPPKPVPASQRDDAPEIRSAFTPPGVAMPPPADNGNMVVSWNAANGAANGDGIKSMVVQSPLRKGSTPEVNQPAPAAPAPQLATPASAPAPAPAPAHASVHVGPPQPGQRAGTVPAGVARANVAPSAAEPSAAEPSAAEPSAAAPQSAVAHAELIRAFLAGAGVPDLDLKGGLTPHTMGMLGQLLREATQGTLDLLLSRALVKREIHAEMTMIVTRENNPLKFSPNVEVALAHLLAPRGQGFMPPLAAMKDAYDDLRAHQFAFMAGMRAALGGTLRRFDPEQLEERLTDKSIVDTLLPGTRKAKLWAMYATMYAEITREAEDDFHAWFGQAFLQAYEAQLHKMEHGEKE